MKKKIYLVISMLMILSVLTSCDSKSEIPDTAMKESEAVTAKTEAQSDTELTEEIFETETESLEIPLESDTPSDTGDSSAESGESISSDISGLEFSDLADLEFWFGSGAGGWSTTVRIFSDGIFSGYYHDSEAGSIGADYPNGTRYECYFNGKFTSLMKIGDYEYSMKCESLTIEGIVDEERIIDNVKIITSEPYGFDNADEFLLYIPGKKLIELPEMFLSWVQINPENIDSESVDVLTFYGLYNVGGEQGFSSY